MARRASRRDCFLGARLHFAAASARTEGRLRRGRDQWSLLGLTALLYDAVGLAPFKDVLWSASLQPRAAGKKNYTFEPNPELEAVRGGAGISRRPPRRAPRGADDASTRAEASARRSRRR